MERTNPAIRGLPVRPLKQTPVYAGSDCWIEMQFIDRNGLAATPTALSYRIDDLTNGVVIVNDTSLVPSGSTFELDITAAVNQMSNCFKSSQVNQVKVTATYSDGSIQVALCAYELIAIAQPG
jgi:hypothetical protein